MNPEILKLQKQVDELTKQVANLTMKLGVGSMPFEFKEQIRNEVIKGIDSATAVTRSEIVTSTPFDLTLPVNPIGVLVFISRGVEYKIPYL